MTQIRLYGIHRDMRTLAFITALLFAVPALAGDCSSPLVVDRFGAGKIGTPYGFGFQSAAPYGGFPYGGPRLGDYIGPYGPRQDIAHEQAQLSLQRAAEALSLAAGAYRPVGGADATTIIKAHCVDCHNPQNPSGGVDLSMPEGLDCNSLKLVLSEIKSGRMPRGRTPLDAKEVATVESFVRAACNATPSYQPEGDNTPTVDKAVTQGQDAKIGGLEVRITELTNVVEQLLKLQKKNDEQARLLYKRIEVLEQPRQLKIQVKPKQE